MNKQETKDFFNSLASNWDEMTHPDSNKINTILSLASIAENADILDVATGTGVLIPYIKELNPNSITALDISDEMIRLAQSKEENRGVEFLCEDFYNYSGKQFDTIICYQAYPHFEEKKEFIGKLYSLLKPKGRFIIAHPDSKEVINNRHRGKEVQKVSNLLLNAIVESKKFEYLFQVDTLVDTDQFYIISGIKR